MKLMVNQTCPMRYSCEALITRFNCNDCGWGEFDFNKIDLTDIIKKISESKERMPKDV